MFRRQEHSLDEDPKYPAILADLGYFIDDKGCIRSLKAPDMFFDFFYTNNDRHNEVRGEAMRTCEREEVISRLSSLGIKQLYLPSMSTTKPDGPQIPILAPPADVLKTRKRIIVVINDDGNQDLGILAYRELHRDGGLNGGSIINFAKRLAIRAHPDLEPALAEDGATIVEPDQVPGLVVLNTGQLLYSHKMNKALSIRSWNALPRKSISHGSIEIHPVENSVEGHRTPQEHIRSVFKNVIKNPEFVAPGAEVYVIAIENGSEKLVNVLNEDFWQYGDRITAMAVVHSWVNNSQVSDRALKAFLHMRTRQWRVAEEIDIDPSKCIGLPTDYHANPTHTVSQPSPVDWSAIISSKDGAIDCRTDAQRLFSQSPHYTEETAGSGSHDTFAEADAVCPTFAGGDTWVGECILTQPTIQRAILDFFEEVAQDTKSYSNPAFKLDHVPAPTPDNPFTLSADDVSLPPEMTSAEQSDITAAKAQLQHMKTALAATPIDNVAVASCRKGLVERIANKELEIEELENKALATGSLGAGAAQELREAWEHKSNREKWEVKKPGPAIPFAGVEADSEMVRSAGCLATADEELARLELDEKQLEQG